MILKYRTEYFHFENCRKFHLKTSNEMLEGFFLIVKTIHQKHDELGK